MAPHLAGVGGFRIVLLGRAMAALSPLWALAVCQLTFRGRSTPCNSTRLAVPSPLRTKHGAFGSERSRPEPLARHIPQTWPPVAPLPSRGSPNSVHAAPGLHPLGLCVSCLFGVALWKALRSLSAAGRLPFPGPAAPVSLAQVWAHAAVAGSNAQSSEGSDPQGSKTGQPVRVVLTGGPCGGKSTSLSTVKESLEAKGYAVHCAPEIFTLLLNGGCTYPGYDGGRALVEFQTALVKLQVQMEDSFLRIAALSDRPSIVVFDRGLLDISAYLPPEVWSSVLTASGLDGAGLTTRYNLVVHLLTAADGAEQFYTTANNSARTETPQQARVLDSKIRRSWAAHGNVVVLDNSTNFEAKCQRCVDAIVKQLDSQA